MSVVKCNRGSSCTDCCTVQSLRPVAGATIAQGFLFVLNVCYPAHAVYPNRQYMRCVYLFCTGLQDNSCHCADRLRRRLHQRRQLLYGSSSNERVYQNTLRERYFQWMCQKPVKAVRLNVRRYMIMHWDNELKRGLITRFHIALKCEAYIYFLNLKPVKNLCLQALWWRPIIVRDSSQVRGKKWCRSGGMSGRVGLLVDLCVL